VPFWGTQCRCKVNFEDGKILGFIPMQGSGSKKVDWFALLFPTQEQSRAKIQMNNQFQKPHARLTMVLEPLLQ